MDIVSLVERCRSGDALAWEALVRAHQGRVYAVAWHYMRSPEEARDAAQDVFIRVYRKLDTFRGGDTFLPWLLRLARNVCLDRLREKAARPPASDLPVEEGPQIAAEGPSPEDSAETEGRKRLLYRALDRMSEKGREMILLKEIQGLALEEISSLLGLPVGTVKSRSNRARLELASAIRRLDPGYGAAGGSE
ncbi:MAG TPA: sigma-70 family RNA polymerase sigma factor [Candidatus Saccharimonadales bacterium]|nr:sigma-70 family RNA polymerase sigma factor [Candidatus Saccharimonadales bacterium]